MNNENTSAPASGSATETVIAGAGPERSSAPFSAEVDELEAALGCVIDILDAALEAKAVAIIWRAQRIQRVLQDAIARSGADQPPALNDQADRPEAVK